MSDKMISKRSDYAKFRGNNGSYYVANVGTKNVPVYTREHFKYAAYAINFAKAARTINVRIVVLSIAIAVTSLVAVLINVF
jgi:hypothetical protein